MSVDRLAKQLSSTAAMSGAGAFVVDDVVDRVIGSVTALQAGDVCKDLSFVDRAVNESAKNLLTGPQLVAAREAVRNAIKAATCDSAATKSQFVSRLQRYKARTVEAHPVSADPGTNMVIYKVRLGPYSETRVRLPAKAGTSLARSALLRLHCDGTVTYLRPGAHVRATLKATKAAAVAGQPGWVLVEFGVKGGSLAIQGSAVVGRQATVFVDSTGRVAGFVAWATPTSAAALPATPVPATGMPATALPEAPADMPRDSVTGQPAVTEPPGVSLDLTIRNTNDANATGASPRGGYIVPGVGVGAVPLLEEPVATVPPTTEPVEPLLAPLAPEPATPSACSPAPAVSGLSSPGTFFCMTKRTFIIVIVMLVVACCLASVGYWIYRKKAMGPDMAAGGPGAPPGLDDLSFGGPPGPGANMGMGR